MGLGMGWMDLCAGLFYEHRFAMLIINCFPRYIALYWNRCIHGKTEVEGGQVGEYFQALVSTF